MKSKSSSESAAPAAKVVLRKKAPYWCRWTDLGKYTCLKPLADSDIFDLCDICLNKQKALVKKADAPLIPAPAIDESENWRPSGRTGTIWPI